MSAACPVLSLVQQNSVAGAMAAMDCQISDAVETGYDRLFGSGGAFSTVLTAALTIYIALLAYGFLTGRTRITIAMLSPKLAALILVVSFVTFWPAYHILFCRLFMEGPDAIASALLDEKGSATAIFAGHLDQLIAAFSDIAQNFATQSADADADTKKTLLSTLAGPQTLFWAAGIILLLSTLGVLILTRMVLYLLLVLGPVFILLGLFEATRGLFFGWLRMLFLFAIAPLITILGGHAALSLFAPLIGYIGQSQSAVTALGDTDDLMRPVMILFIGSVIYAVLLFVLMRVTAGLARDVHAHSASAPSAADLPPAAATTQSPQPRQSMAESSTHLREIQLSAHSSTAASAEHVVRSPEIRIAVPARPDGVSRTRGLGMRFRKNTPAAKEKS